MLSKDEVFDKLIGYFEELFEIPREKIAMESRLYEDLDLDSIDAVDLVVKLQELTNRRIKPEAFKSVRTVADVVKCIEELLADDTTAR